MRRGMEVHTLKLIVTEAEIREGLTQSHREKRREREKEETGG